MGHRGVPPAGCSSRRASRKPTRRGQSGVARRFEIGDGEMAIGIAASRALACADKLCDRPRLEPPPTRHGSPARRCARRRRRDPRRASSAVRPTPALGPAARLRQRRGDRRNRPRSARAARRPKAVERDFGRAPAAAGARAPSTSTSSCGREAPGRRMAWSSPTLSSASAASCSIRSPSWSRTGGTRSPAPPSASSSPASPAGRRLTPLRCAPRGPDARAHSSVGRATDF